MSLKKLTSDHFRVKDPVAFCDDLEYYTEGAVTVQHHVDSYSTARHETVSITSDNCTVDQKFIQDDESFTIIQIIQQHVHEESSATLVFLEATDICVHKTTCGVTSQSITSDTTQHPYGTTLQSDFLEVYDVKRFAQELQTLTSGTIAVKPTKWPQDVTLSSQAPLDNLRAVAELIQKHIVDATILDYTVTTPQEHTVTSYWITEHDVVITENRHVTPPRRQDIVQQLDDTKQAVTETAEEITSELNYLIGIVANTTHDDTHEVTGCYTAILEALENLTDIVHSTVNNIYELKEYQQS